ncbi:MAG: 30S ribosomal protein S18 [Chitinivibrionales bacterium]|nr:30S ribosomal protein S18 [Chitinivibrionales bacterium]
MPRYNKGPRVKRSCWYCANRVEPDYKNSDVLRNGVTDRGKIMPKRTTGTCATHQRRVAREVKRARHLALLPFVAENIHG